MGSWPSADQQGDLLADVRSRLVSATAQIDLASGGDAPERVRQALTEVVRAQQALLLLAHIEKLKAAGLADELSELDRRLADGWVPPARPAEAVIAEFNERYG